ncbi:glycosyltransferase [Victivallis sp. Marseille-Q1083]|uniref:glycosyltransferase n=1 Tax=Victivallis sp. Marseille-Q1083 TaxID=2717288 RepID=UPI00158DCE64|nr:glycosyltransferase [Victivallis sp. Marseille-Q1083]
MSCDVGKPVAVSVIVPIYNVETRLEACLNSLVGQSLTSLEIILVNDGSTDRSGAIAEKFAAACDFVHYITQPNRGVSAARNAGLARARGDYVGFCDADDYVDREMFEVLYRNAVANDADLSSCRLQLADGECRSNHPTLPEGVFEHGEYLSEWFLPLLLRRGVKVYGFPVISLFRRELLETYSIRFPEDLHMLEDTVFYLAVLPRIRRMVTTRQVLYHYIFFENSVTAQYFTRKTVSRLKQETNAAKVTAHYLDALRQSGLTAAFPDAEDELLLNLLRQQSQIEILSDQPLREKIRRIGTFVQMFRSQVGGWRLVTNRSLPLKKRLLFVGALLGAPVVYWFCRLNPPH